MKAVFGIGTGRCGSKSLAYLLNSQENVWASHEFKPILPFEKDVEMLHKKLDYLERRSGKVKPYMFGDTALYYLWYVEELIERYPDIRMPCLKRVKKEVVRSFYRKAHKRGISNPVQYGVIYRNFWQNDPNAYRSDWDIAFPKFGGRPNLRRAISRYYDYYYSEVGKYVFRYPNNIRVFDMLDLNTEEGVNNILDFCGVESKNCRVGLQVRHRWTEVKVKERT